MYILIDGTSSLVVARVLESGHFKHVGHDVRQLPVIFLDKLECLLDPPCRHRPSHFRVPNLFNPTAHPFNPTSCPDATTVPVLVAALDHSEP